MLVTWKNIVCFIDEEERAMTIVFVEVKKILGLLSTVRRNRIKTFENRSCFYQKLKG